MKYQLSTFGGENILLEDNQYFKILQGWDAGGEEFAVGDRRVPRKAVSYLGFTKEAAEQFRIEESEYERSLPPAEAKKLREQKREFAMRSAQQRNYQVIESGRQSYERRWKSLGAPDIVVEVEKEVLPASSMSAEESERGAAEYYLNEAGERMYS